MKMHILLAAALVSAGCTTAPAASGSPALPAGSATLRLGEEGRLGDLSVRPLRVEEDSRCPASVQRVQAGTVRLAVRLSDRRGTREIVLRLGIGEPVDAERSIRLLAACPWPRAPGAIRSADYSFLISADADGANGPAFYPCPSA